MNKWFVAIFGSIVVSTKIWRLSFARRITSFAMSLCKPSIFSRYGEFSVPASLISLISKSSFKSLNTLILLVILPMVVNTVSKTRVSTEKRRLAFP